MPNINLHLGDSLQAMRDMPNNKYTLAIVDPPFGIGNFTQTNGTFADGVKRKRTAVTWNDATPCPEYFEQLRRVSKHQIIFGANYYNCFNGKHGAIVWVKNQPMPNFSKAVIASCTMHKKIEVYTQTWTNFVHDGRCTQHPCEMPVQLYAWILHHYAKPGDTILDTHLGSGSIACACYDAGYDLDAWEIDPEYHAAATARYNEYSRQTKLF